MATILLIGLLMSATICSIPIIGHAQEGMRGTLSGNSLDVLLEPSWSDGGHASFTVSFLNPVTSLVQVHIDYTFAIKQGEQEIFNAIPQGQALLHTAEGVVTIPPASTPFKFPVNGDFTIEVSVVGINFIPINPESASFNISVTPEFPIFAPLLAVTIGAVAFVGRFALANDKS